MIPDTPAHRFQRALVRTPADRDELELALRLHLLRLRELHEGESNPGEQKRLRASERRTRRMLKTLERPW